MQLSAAEKLRIALHCFALHCLHELREHIGTQRAVEVLHHVLGEGVVLMIHVHLGIAKALGLGEEAVESCGAPPRIMEPLNELR